MSIRVKESCAIENCFKYFPYFNHKLFENPSNIQEEDYSIRSDSDNQSLEDSSTNISHESINYIDNEEKFIPLNLLDLSPIKISYHEPNSQILKPKKLFDSKDVYIDKTENKSSLKLIQPELQKYKLPKSLFETNKNNKNENIKKDEKEILQDSSSDLLLTNKLNLSTQPFIPKIKVYPTIVYSCFTNNRNKFGQLPINFMNCLNYQRKNIFELKKKKKKQEFVEREGDWSCYRCKNINFSFRNICNKCKLPKEESEKKFEEVGEALLKLADVSIYEKKNEDNFN